MTVEEILARKRELLDARRTETDRFSLFFLNEELADLNARLRSLRRGTQAQGAVRGDPAMDRAQYLDWRSSERDGEMDAARAACLDTLRRSAEALTPRQRELFEAWRSGERVTALAERYGVDKSTVSRTLTRCKARLRAEAESRAGALRLPDGTALDLADAETARVVLSCLTSRQAVCLYLYYGEWLSLRECGELLSVDHAAVLRTVRRGLRAIRDTLRCGAFTLENADALGDLAYALYVEAGMPDELPEEPPKAAWARRRLKRGTPVRKAGPSAKRDVRASDVLPGRAPRRPPERPAGRLLALLYALRRSGPLYRYLTRLFERITKKKRGNRT